MFFFQECLVTLAWLPLPVALARNKITREAFLLSKITIKMPWTHEVVSNLLFSKFFGWIRSNSLKLVKTDSNRSKLVIISLNLKNCVKLVNQDKTSISGMSGNAELNSASGFSNPVQTRQNPSKPVKTRQNPTKPIITCQNLLFFYLFQETKTPVIIILVHLRQATWKQPQGRWIQIRD